MGKVPNHKAKKGHNKKGTLPFKRARLDRFLNRHVDQVWKDVRADPEKGVGPNGTDLCGIRTDSALPRTAKQVIDEDLPGMGQFYCVETGKWFVDEKALAGHKKGRFYKMRVKELKGAAPHSQRDADMAVGLGVDNGPKLGRDPRPKAMEME